jgi:hypothetical protein
MAKIIFLDIETSPLIAYVWKRYETNTAKVLRESELLTFAYKRPGEKPIGFTRLNYRRGSERALVKKLWHVLDQADIVVGHNLESFDKRKSNSFFSAFGLPDPSDYKVVDTLTEARRIYSLSSYKLDDICQHYKLGKKIDTGGIDLWHACMSAKVSEYKPAYVKMLKYNLHDTVLAESLYNFLLPRINNHPNLALIDQRPNSCPRCSGTVLHKLGFRYTPTMVYRRFRCYSCQGIVSGIKAEKVTKPVYK